MYQINAREPPEKTNKSENFFQILSLTQSLHQTLQFIDAIAQHHRHTSDWILPNGTSDIALAVSRIMRFRLFGRLAHDVLVTLPACDIAFDALVPDDDGLNPRK